MNSKGKYIGLNQRIPFEVLDSAIHFYIENGVFDKNFIFLKMQEYTVGINRANKATSYVVQILSRQSFLLDKFKIEIASTPYSSLRTDDRKAFCLCLISLTYPITYDLLVALSQGFKVQNQINKKFISEKVMSIYGSNRSVDIAIDALLPIIIDLNTIKRERVGIYSITTKMVIKNLFISELIIYTDIKLSGSKSILVEDSFYKPWYAYFDNSDFNIKKVKYLLQLKDSSTGQGYIIIN